MVDCGNEGKSVTLMYRFYVDCVFQGFKSDATILSARFENYEQLSQLCHSCYD